MTTNNNLIVKNFSLKEQHFMGSHHVQGTGSLWQKEVDSNELKCFNLFLLELFNKILLTGCLILLKEVFVHWVVYFFQVVLCLKILQSIVESFYFVKYGSSIITSNVFQIISLMKQKHWCFLRNDTSKIVHFGILIHILS